MKLVLNILKGTLKRRDDSKIIGTEKEKNLYQSQDTFYNNLGSECNKYRICIDLFIFPSTPFVYMDVATLSKIFKK